MQSRGESWKEQSLISMLLAIGLLEGRLRRHGVRLGGNEFEGLFFERASRLAAIQWRA
jgi:hypothetical protein